MKATLQKTPFALALLALTGTALLYVNLTLTGSAEERGEKIARHCDQENSGFQGEFSNAEMVLFTGGGDQVSRELTVKRHEVSSDGDRTLLTFSKPADVKDTKLLTWSHLKDDDDQWIYLPSMKRVKRISSQSRTGSFLGSEFTYEDLGGREVSKFHHRLLKDTALKSRKVWVLEQRPKEKHSGYQKLVVWMDQQFCNPLKIDYYDRKGEKLKQALFTGYHQLESKWWRPKKTVMRNYQTRKKTELHWQNIELQKRFPASEFQKEYLNQ